MARILYILFLEIVYPPADDSYFPKIEDVSVLEPEITVVLLVNEKPPFLKLLMQNL